MESSETKKAAPVLGGRVKCHICSQEMKVKDFAGVARHEGRNIFCCTDVTCLLSFDEINKIVRENKDSKIYGSLKHVNSSE